jgi:hypothetical protein
MTMCRQEQMSKDCDWKQTIHLGIYIYLHFHVVEGWILIGWRRQWTGSKNRRVDKFRIPLCRYGAGCSNVLVCEVTIVRLQDRLKLMMSTSNRREERR